MCVFGTYQFPGPILHDCVEIAEFNDEPRRCWFLEITAQVSSDGGNLEWRGPRNPHIQTPGGYLNHHRRNQRYRHHRRHGGGGPHRSAGHRGCARMRGGWHSRFGRGRHHVSSVVLSIQTVTVTEVVAAIVMASK